MHLKSKLLAAAFLAASAFAAAPASAIPIPIGDPVLVLNHLNFVGGGTANGQFTYYTPLDIPYNFNITTTAGTMPGGAYTTAGNPNTNHYLTGLPSGVGEIIQFQLPNYQGYLQLAFLNPITNAANPLDFANSFECSGFADVVPGPCYGSQRFFDKSISGKAGLAPVPEPSSISLLAVAMLGVAGLMFARRRKAAAAAV